MWYEPFAGHSLIVSHHNLMERRMKATLAAVAIASFCTNAFGMGAFEWEVVNPFPLMMTKNAQTIAPRRDAGETMVAVLKRLPPNDLRNVMRENPATLRGPGYSPAYARGAPREIRIRLKGAPSSAQCRWSVADSKGIKAFRVRAPRALSCSNFTALTVPFGGGIVTVTSDLGTQSETIVIDEKLILGFGDSYSSGEGNPDNPVHWEFSRWENIFNLQQPEEDRLRWAVLLNSTLVRDARWLHEGCHRTLWSYQALAAIAYAAADPHRVVTFLFYSCSGAIVDELISIAQEPLIDPRSVSLPQIDQAVKDLCPVTPVKDSDGRLRCTGKMRKADAVLLTIGGNDAGFAQVIADAILPSRDDPIACMLRNAINAMPAAQATPLIAKLPARWADVQKAFDRSLSVAADRVFVPAYPNLLYDSKGAVCDERSKPMLSGLKTLFTGTNFLLTKTKAQEAYDGLVHPMELALQKAPSGWHVVSSHLASVAPHGICAVKSDPAKELEYPLPGRHNELWDEAPSPALWQAYDPARERWFRTPNDSILTLWTTRGYWINEKRLGAFECWASTTAATQEEAEARIQGLAALKSIGIDLMVGSFHPTARYHALAADALLPAIVQRIGK
jgi:hypothetical protein